MRLHRTSTRYYTYAVVLRITTEFYVRSIPAQFFFMKFVAKSVTSMVCTLGLSKPCVNATFVLFEEKAGIGWFTMFYSIRFHSNMWRFRIAPWEDTYWLRVDRFAMDSTLSLLGWRMSRYTAHVGCGPTTTTTSTVLPKPLS